MLAVTRYRVPDEDGESFRDRALPAIRALTARPGCVGATLGRAVDDPTLWVLATTWESVGAYRRALSSYDVKVNAVPVMSDAIDEPTAFEDLVTWTPGGDVQEFASARAQESPATTGRA